MNHQAHIVDIDTIVLGGADPHDPAGLGALLEAQVRQALNGAGFGTATGIADGETRVAGATARAVVQSIQGDPHAL
jgi:hypothetical protein